MTSESSLELDKLEREFLETRKKLNRSLSIAEAEGHYVKAINLIQQINKIKAMKGKNEDPE